MNEHYTCNICPVCSGSIATVPNLADPGLDDILDQIARDLFTSKINAGSIPPELFKYKSKELIKAMYEGFDNSFDTAQDYTDLAKYLVKNINLFSAAKSIFELRELAKFASENADFTAFRNKVIDAGYHFNKTHLATEYNTAVAGSQMAANWNHFENNEVEFLEYSTAGDGRVRPEHAKLDGFTAKLTDPVWKTIYPPNAWNCRCNVVPGVDQNSGKVFITNDVKDWAKEQYNIDDYFNKNTGITKKIFSPKMIKQLSGLSEADLIKKIKEIE